MESQHEIDPLKLAAVGVAGVAAASMLAGCATLGRSSEPCKTRGNVTFTWADIPGKGNAKVLNYALVLESLETQFYDDALARLTTGGKDSRGVAIEGLGLSLDEPDVRYVKMFRAVESQHRLLLQTALTAFELFHAVKPSKYDFGLMSASRQQVMETLYGVERTGAEAYLGAIKYFPSKEYLTIAASIQGTEARHYAAIAAVNNLLFKSNQEVAPRAGENHGAETPREPDDVLGQISRYIVER